MLITLDYTTISSYRTCGQYFKYRIADGLTGSGASYALDFGRWAHRGLEHLRGVGEVTPESWFEAEFLASGQPPHVDHNAVADPVGAALHSLVAEHTTEPFFALLPLERRSLKHLLTLLLRYQEHYGSSHSLPPSLQNEVELTRYLGETPKGNSVMYCGNIDGVAGEVLLERKTTSYLGPQFIDRTNPSAQATGYCWLTGKRKVLFDGISTSGYGGTKNSAAPQPDRWTINTDPAKLFMRSETIRSESQIEEWKVRVLRIADRMIEDLDANLFDTNEPDGCTRFNTTCPFIDICRTQDLQVRQTLLSNMTKEPWENFKLEIK